MHQIGDQIVPPLELDVDLCERVERLVLERKEAVVGRDDPQHDDDEDDQRKPKHRHSKVGGWNSGYDMRRYAGAGGASFAIAWRTASARAASSVPSRTSGWPVSTFSSTPRATGMRRQVAAGGAPGP